MTWVYDPEEALRKLRRILRLRPCCPRCEALTDAQLASLSPGAELNQLWLSGLQADQQTIIRMLAATPGEYIGSAEISQRIWGHPAKHRLHVQIARLRGRMPVGLSIDSLPRAGYRLIIDPSYRPSEPPYPAQTTTTTAAPFGGALRGSTAPLLRDYDHC